MSTMAVLLASLFAPAPVPAVKEKDRPVLYEHFRKVYALQWDGKTYPFTFSVDTGVYRCDNHVGASVCWTGTWELDPTGKAILREKTWYFSEGAWTDHDSDGYNQEFKVAWKDGELMGEGWSTDDKIHPIRFLRSK